MIRGAVALRIRYTKYSYNLTINLLYLVVFLLIAAVPLIQGCSGFIFPGSCKNIRNPLIFTKMATYIEV